LRRFLNRQRCRIEQLSPELLRESIDGAEPGRVRRRRPSTAAEIELWTVHRIEQARLFFLAARIALERRSGESASLEPMESTFELDRLRRALCEELRLSVLDGIDVPLGLVVCALWDPSAWEPENLALAGLGLDASPEGRVLYAHVLLASGDVAGAGRSLARAERELRKPAGAAYWLTKGAWHAAREEFAAALDCFQEGASEPSARGAWSGSLALALAFARGVELAEEKARNARAIEPRATHARSLGRRAGRCARAWMADTPAAEEAQSRALGRMLASCDAMHRGLAREMLEELSVVRVLARELGATRTSR
jgi:hypothetical protein